MPVDEGQKEIALVWAISSSRRQIVRNQARKVQ